MGFTSNRAFVRRCSIGLLALGIAFGSVACTSVDERRTATLERAGKVLEQGDVERAIAVLEKFRAYDPRDLEVSLRLAEIRLDQGRAADALRLLRGIPGDVTSEIEGPLADAYSLSLARASALAGSPDRAAALLIALDQRELAPDEVVETLIARLAEQRRAYAGPLPTAWRARLALEHSKRNRMGLAVEEFRRLPREDPHRAKSLEKILHGAVERGWTDLLESFEERHEPPTTPWKLLAEHHVSMARGREGEAAAVEERFIELFPAHPRRFDVLLSLSRRELRSGHPERGLEFARLAGALRPSQPEPLLEQALALDALGRRDAAARALAAVQGIDPRNAAAAGLSKRWRDRDEAALKASGGSARMSVTFDGQGWGSEQGSASDGSGAGKRSGAES